MIPPDPRPPDSFGLPGLRSRRALVVLGLILAAFVAIRGPVIARQPGGLDEEWFAIPGLTVVECGIPRMPHVPQRSLTGRFHRADEALFALPPLSFYWEGLFFAVLPPSYGTARLASMVAALMTLVLAFELGRTLYGDEAAALCAAAICSLCRAFYFPAMTARPDMLCTMLGLGALLSLVHWQRTRRRGLLVVAGFLLGLGGLTHPFALVYALQAGAWVLIVGHGWRRVTSAMLLAAVAIAVLLLWLPLILLHPAAFPEQFCNNVLDRAGPGLLSRMVFAWPALRHHAWMMWEHLGAIQFLLLLGGLLPAAVLDWRSTTRGRSTAWILAGSSVYLLSTVAGQHPTQFYWSYPTTLLSLCLGRALTALANRCAGRRWQRRIVRWGGGLLIVMMMLPGAGLRTWWAHLQHWHDINYNAPLFARRILAELPENARYTVDREFVLDFYAAGRQTLIAETYKPYFRAQDFPYDYLVISRHGLEENIAAALRGTLVRTYGDREDLFACYAEVYRPSGDHARRGE